jgi:hypothetical protein
MFNVQQKRSLTFVFFVTRENIALKTQEMHHGEGEVFLHPEREMHYLIRFSPNILLSSLLLAVVNNLQGNTNTAPHGRTFCKEIVLLFLAYCCIT